MSNQNLTDDQWMELHRLENAIYEAGIDGGEGTSAAIEELYDKEKELGVYVLSATCPRWQTRN